VADDADGTVAVEWAESGPRSGRDDEAFVASATPRDPVLLAMRAAGAASFAPPVALTSSGDGDVLLAAGGSHVLAAYQQADRLRLRVVP
jgi:precorrin-3B methylase